MAYSEKWFSNRPAPNRALRIFCFPFAGGGGKTYLGWQSHFPEAVDIVPVQLPGRENRLGEAPFHSMSALVEALLPVFRPHLEKPFAFFGHSMGAKVAFELALALEDLRLPGPRCLFLSASRAPHIPEPAPLHHLERKEFADALRRFGATPEAVLQNEELLDLFLPLLRADFTLDETYARGRGQCRVSSPIHVLYGSDDDEAPENEVLPWGEYTAQQFSATNFSGGHFFFKDNPAILAETLCALLETRPN